MDLDTLLKAVVPLAFLAIWALTALFNREGNTLPARTVGPPNPYGPRPSIPPRVAGPADRPPALRWGPQAAAPPRAGGDDDIVIIEGPRLTRSVAPRPPRRIRPKPTPPVAPKPAPIISTRIGMGNVTQSVNQQLVAPLTIEPLTSQASAVVSRAVVATAAKPVDLTSSPLSALGLGRSLIEPQRLREAIVISEILRPPLALRGLDRRR
ncbi:MAG TPA: hypothetical protein VGH33_16215 [Isosphaeraceae bacterium]